MKSLSELTSIYKTDKGMHAHRYTDFYDLFFTPMRESATKILEIGVFRWKSLLALEEYFPKAAIIGIDRIRYKPRVRGRIATYRCRQELREHLAELIRVAGPNFDIIIDDGGHHMRQQQISLGFLFRYVKPGGIYIIEDLHTSLNAKFYDDSKTTTLAMCQQFIETQTIESSQMTGAEIQYLNETIENLTLMRVNTAMRGIVGVIKKKQHAV